MNQAPDDFEQLYKEWYPRFFGFFRRKGFSIEDSQDLTQRALLRVFSNINTFRGQSFGRWMFTIAVNVFRNEVRRRHTSGREAKEDSLEALLEEHPASLASQQGIGSSPQRDALDGIVERERVNALRKAISKMPHQMKMCCYLRYLRGMKYRDIAVVMKISLGAVKAHLHQARQRLKEELGIDLEPETES
ncbi:MAG TPA: sigma-70 family RNA polymerase sigma factor [Thermoanaerobaculia bacterium]|jgi:RNA polymerase sigma-70 factor (ECF subfamily)|nr:sigma-70 family RNA polymerase sigma factor [Thermoanaerobaculia bacterium]